MTPDGTRAVSGHLHPILIIWDLKTGQVLRTLKGHTGGIFSVRVTPDGSRVISGSSDNTIIVWDIETGERLSLVASNSAFNNLSIFIDGILACGEGGNIFIFHTAKKWLFPETCFVTARSIWDFKKNIYLPLTSDCPICGHRFETEKKYIDTIKFILNNNNITPDDSPCLKLPKEAWEEPKLLSNCPKCNEAIKFNPFIVDNRGRY